MSTIHWGGAVSGDWATATDWSTGTIPGSGDDVFIDPSGTYTVTIDDAEAANSLTVNDTGATVADNNTLTIGTTLAVSAGTFELNSGGTVAGGTLSANGGVFAFDGGTLSGVTYEGAIALAHFEAALTLTGTVTMTGADGTGAGAINDIGASSQLVLAGAATIDNATIDLGNSASAAGSAIINTGGGTATIGATTTIQLVGGAGSYAYLGSDTGVGVSSGTIVNDGSIVAADSDTYFKIDPQELINDGSVTISDNDSAEVINSSFINNASVSVSGGGALIFQPSGSLSNNGTIAVGSGSLLDVAAATTAQLGTIVAAAGAEIRFGTLNNTGAIFSVASGVSLGGTIEGGAIDGTIDGGQLGLTGTVTLAGAGGVGPGVINGGLSLVDTATINNATINLDDSGIMNSGGLVATLGATTTIDQTGASASYIGGQNANGDGTIVNDGSIIGQGSDGAELTINPTTFRNNGSILVENGDTVAIAPGVFSNLVGTTLMGGKLAVETGSTLLLPDSSTIVTDDAGITLSGTGDIIAPDPDYLFGEAFLYQTLTTIGRDGLLAFTNGGGWSSTNTLSDAGTLDLSDSTLVQTGITVTSTGHINGFGTISTTLTNRGTIAVEGVETLDVESNTFVSSTGEVDLAGGTFETKAIQNARGGLISGYGVVEAKVTDSGSIDATGGVLEFTQAVTGVGSMDIAGGATLQADTIVDSTLTATFDGAAAVLALKTPNSFKATIAGFAPTDVIDLLARKATSAVLGTGGALLITNGAHTVATLHLTGSYTGDTFSVASDGHGGTDITVAPTAPAPAVASAHPLVAAAAGFAGESGVVPHFLGDARFERPVLLAVAR